MAKTKLVYTCKDCGHQTPRWLGRCPECNHFNTLEEETFEKIKPATKKSFDGIVISDLSNIEMLSEDRLSTKIAELDRVLSGGFVAGSLTLVGGDPGIGKSTILLQISENIGLQDKKILYISGEESRQQIKLRADRLDIKTKNLFVMAETNISVIEQAIKQFKPGFLIIDSIQTMTKDELTSSAGSVVQVRECTALFMKIAKGMGVTVILVGHVTKDGAIAGPKVLEHMVDTVLYFEGEKKESYRIIRSVKNRFGSTNEIGVFEMREKGLFEISNPSEYMLSGRPLGVSGSSVTCSVEGTRPILVEVQALVTYTNFGMARRTATGMDHNRVAMLIAVLEKRLGYTLSTYDSYVNIAGGMKIVEPALDASVILSIASSFKDKVVDPYTLVFGEVGLAGEMRAVTMAEKRVEEAGKLGFTQCVLPQANMKGLKKNSKIRTFGASNISELLQLCFDV